MDNTSLDILRNNHRYLMNNVRFVDVQDFLFEKGILKRSDVDLLSSIESHDEQIRKFLNMLTFKGPQAFDLFMEALVETGAIHVVYKLCPNFKLNNHNLSYSELKTSLQEKQMQLDRALRENEILRKENSDMRSIFKECNIQKRGD